MSKYILLENPDEIPPESFKPFFFNSESFLNAFPVSDRRTFWYYEQETGVARIKLSLRVDEDIAVSPVRGPYGGMNLDEGVDKSVIESFFREAHQRLHEEGITKLNIVMVPDKFFPDGNRLLYDVFSSCGYKVNYKELDFFTYTQHQTFRSLLHRLEKNRLNKCLKAGFSVQKEDWPDTEALYELLAANRKHKGYPVTMNFSTFDFFLKHYPDNYPVFTVRDQGKLVAMAVTVVVHPELLYIFYNAHDSAYDRYSPVIMANEMVYRYARSEGFSILDYGIATEEGIPNTGLMKFKERMGGIAASKFVWERRLGNTW